MSNRRNKVTKLVTPVSKVGNLLIPPNWRYDALFFPGKYKLSLFASRNPTSGSSALKRFLSLGLPHNINYVMSPSVKALYKALTPESKPIFLAQWKRSFKRRKVKKITVETNSKLFQKSPVWNMEAASYIADPFLCRLVMHHSRLKYDSNIAYALDMGSNEAYSELFKFIGYCIFAGITDTKIAIRWKIPTKHVEAIRLIFFDFSFFPKDRLAMLTHLRQLTANGCYSDVDFLYFKRVFELGELGLKAQTDFYTLTAKEKKTIEEYLGKSVVANVFNLNFSLRTQKDAVEYGTVVGHLSNYYIKNVEKDYFESKIRNLDASTRRIDGDLLNEDHGMTPLDKQYMALLTEHSLIDEQIEYKTLASLK